MAKCAWCNFQENPGSQEVKLYWMCNQCFSSKHVVVRHLSVQQWLPLAAILGMVAIIITSLVVMGG